jgi:glycosyltransferase 2 family protein
VRDPTLSARSAITGGLGVVVAAALLTWCFRRAGVAEVWAALSALSLLAVLPALACELTVQLARSLKWASILSGTAKVRYRSALVAVVIGAASTHLIPLRLDEVLRAAVLGRREGIPSAKVLGTVAIDRLIDILIAGLLLGVVAMFSDLEGWMQTGARVLWGVFVVGVVVLIGFVRSEDRLGARLRASSIPGAARLASLLSSLAEGVRALPRGRALVGVAVGAALEWAATIALYAWLLHLFEVAGHRSLGLVMALGNSVAYAVPNVPGALGTYEAVQSSVLTAPSVGLAPAEAMAIALAAHAVIMIPVTIAGFALGAREWRLARQQAGQDASLVGSTAP